MRYKAIKHLKTTSKELAITDSLASAHEVIKKAGGVFAGFSYMGGFPCFRDEKGKVYSIQGAVVMTEGRHVVCSIPEAELQAYSF